MKIRKSDQSILGFLEIVAIRIVFKNRNIWSFKCEMWSLFAISIVWLNFNAYKITHFSGVEILEPEDICLWETHILFVIIGVFKCKNCRVADIFQSLTGGNFRYLLYNIL